MKKLNNKVKPKDKKISLNKKIIIKIITIVLALGILTEIGFMFFSNNFAMLNVLQIERPYDIVMTAIDENKEQDRYILKVDNLFSVPSMEIEEHIVATFYIVKVAENSYEFTAKIKENGYEIYDAYYKDDFYYTNKASTKTKIAIFTASGAIDYIFQGILYNIFPLSLNPVDLAEINDIKVETGFVMSLSPFYIGQKYTITNPAFNGFETTIHLDLSGDLMYREFIAISGAASQELYIKYPRPYNFTLEFPTDLNTYITT